MDAQQTDVVVDRKRYFVVLVAAAIIALMRSTICNMDSIEESDLSSGESDTDLEQENNNLETHIDEIITEVFGQ